MEPSSQRNSSRSSSRSLAAIIAGLLALLLIGVIVLFLLPNLFSIGSLFSSNDYQTSTFNVAPASGIGSGNDSSSLSNATKVKISYPSDYAQLANYSLQLVNANRSSAGLEPVTLSPIPSAQEHADSMLEYGYFSHWDTQGLKPYMRYTILNGTGYVEENVAYEFTTLPTFTSTHSVERALSALEWQMMENDSACCANGHRDNILSPFHNRVSIGVAYDATHVYFVEDFENYYLSLATPIVTGDLVTLAGNSSQQLNPTSVLIFYDETPTALTSSQLNTAYYGPYGQGEFVGGVVPPCNGLISRCSEYDQGVTAQASAWRVSPNYIYVQFSLSGFTQRYGDGVYTIYLVQSSQGNPEFLTSISVFVFS